MADTPTLKTIAIDADLHYRIDMYATENKLTIREVVDTALKLFLPTPRLNSRVKKLKV
jgi:hypothetical protein